MSKARPPRPSVQRRPIRRRSYLIAAAVVLVVGILAAAMVLRSGTERSAGADVGFSALNGRWLRPDGGYVLEIRNAAAGGAIEATYLNPRPINVARAEATRQGSTLRVIVELRAPGYPGSTYTLAYDPKRDQLAGSYFQAALGQTFDVFFERMK
ncbi:MAG TPA: hypothetical protein VL086_22300 [Candidatus Nitrosotalea sp.]|jgi:hypothetical protein|nr:hypothetical protein [Candidatus Nitrosotalea sp.]